MNVILFQARKRGATHNDGVMDFMCRFQAPGELKGGGGVVGHEKEGV